MSNDVIGIAIAEDQKPPFFLLEVPNVDTAGYREVSA
jgi:hypothetical protein